MKKYHVLSHDREQKWTHQKLIDKITEYYPNAIVDTKQDYPGGFECFIKFNDYVIHFELNKYDKEIRGKNGDIGQNRKKIEGYSKNGYLITLPDDVPPRLLLQLNAILIN